MSEAVGQQLYYHTVGTPQSEDKKFYDLKDYPGWYVGGGVTDDGRYLFITLNKGTESRDKVLYVDLKDPKHPDLSSPVTPLFEKDDAEYYPLGNVGTTIYMQTTLGAPNRKIVSFNIADPSRRTGRLSFRKRKASSRIPFLPEDTWLSTISSMRRAKLRSIL